MGFALRAVERASLPSKQSLVLLAPANSPMPGAFTNARSDRAGYEDLLTGMQRFRGATYLKDGAISATALDSHGRHRVDADFHSWHVLAINSSGNVCGCSRYSSYRRAVDFGSLAVGKSALAQSDVWGPKLKAAVERERRIAAEEDTDFVEVGGWAIAEELRRTTEALRIALATYALGHLLGGCIGVTTATVRHQSASVLRKIGGEPLTADATELPRYFDPQYECEMEILRFHSATPNPKFLPWIDQIRREMCDMQVVTARLEHHPEAIRDQNAVEEFGASFPLACAWQLS
jgi:hypothetical protein